MNENQKLYLQSTGVNDGLIIVNGTAHVFDIPTLPKTLDEWKKQYTYRQYQVIAKHHLSICARTTKEMSLQTRVVEKWKRMGHLVMKDPACRNLFAPSVPVNASTKSPDDQSKSASSIIIAPKPKPEPEPQASDDCSRLAKEAKLIEEQDRKELKRLRESLGFLDVKVDRNGRSIARLDQESRTQKRSLSKLGKEVRKRKDENRLLTKRVETAPVASKMKQKILKIVQVGMLADDTNLDLLMHIQDEVEKEGSRLHKEIVFNASLPESERLSSAELYTIIERVANKSLN